MSGVCINIYKIYCDIYSFCNLNFVLLAITTKKLKSYLFNFFTKFNNVMFVKY